MTSHHSTASTARWRLGILLAALLSARDAHAYLDPSTGSMILQGIIGGMMAGLFIVRRQWSQLKGWFSRRRATDGESSQASAGRDEQ
jgi:hypothetical protein